ncbi:unnamed protein product [Clonostachys rosea]|uniref:Transcription factor domain-containing protein n=1 Tax=Bionectria ochroleuca TaxID=29856 RepID=A0ABY6UEI6_BIOOC|nr:unnamed protein product [Clonostachys rosea]
MQLTEYIGLLESALDLLRNVSTSYFLKVDHLAYQLFFALGIRSQVNTSFSSFSQTSAGDEISISKQLEALRTLKWWIEYLAFLALKTGEIMASRVVSLEELELPVRPQLYLISIIKKIAWCYIWTDAYQRAIDICTVDGFSVPDINMIDRCFVDDNINLTVNARHGELRIAADGKCAFSCQKIPRLATGKN